MVTRTQGPFPYYSEQHQGVTGDAIRGSTHAPGSDASTLTALAGELDGDTRTITGQVDGAIQAALTADPQAAGAKARDLAAKGMYAVGLLNDFAGMVDTFDTTVDTINVDYNADVAEAARHNDGLEPGDVGFQTVRQGPYWTRWHRAEGVLDDDADSIAVRFNQGPTDDNVKQLILEGMIPLDAAGLFPTLALTPAEQAQAAAASFFDEWAGLKPPIGDGPMDWFGYVFGQVGLGVGAGIDFLTKIRFGGFKPINALGQFVKPGSLSPFQRFVAGLGRFPTAAGLSPWQRLVGFDPGANFGAKGWKGSVHGNWSTAGKWVGRAGAVVSGVVAGFEEWEESAEYPTDERIGRTTTVAVTTGAGAWAGAAGGAWLGGAIGTAICPGVGTVIGGAVGGLIGGFAGSQAGEWVGDQLKDIGGEVGDAVGDFVDGAGDALSDVGDALTFWD